jgi:ribose transport system ATP-binding protein
VVLRAQGIEKSFGGVRALRGAHFELRRGEVHALLGENGAGKSTMINVLSGVITDYAGRVEIGGEPVSFKGPADAQAAGVATIHQELDLALDMSIAENLFLGREPRTGFLRLLDRRRLMRDARVALSEAGVELDPGRTVRSLRVGERQLVEIVKALSLEARILIMDEPTAALADAEVENLFSVVRDLRERGVSIVYISHRLEELEEIADRATVMRNGETVGTVDMAKTSRGELIRMMVGQPIAALFPDSSGCKGGELLSIEGLTVRPKNPRPGRSDPKGVSLKVDRGEIVGLAGLMGSGRTELLETLFGLGEPGVVEGEIYLEGRRHEPTTPRGAIAAGIGFVPEDRKDLGLVLGQSVGSNATLSALRSFASGGILNGARERQAVDKTISELGIKAAGRSVAVETLSGGNQQKVLFGKQLLTRPRLLLLDEPTRGVDVGAKAEIYALLSDLAGDGMGILMASSELPELLGMCDRIVVLRFGRVVAELDAQDASQEAILEAATSAERKEETV